MSIPTAFNNSSTAEFGTELAATMTGSWATIGTLTYPAVQLIFDNQSTVPIAISVNGGTTTWKTFPAGEAVVLDGPTNKATAATFAFAAGTTFSGNGASGTFSIAYTYKKPG